MTRRYTRSSWGIQAPSRKWFAAQTTALSALAIMWATTGAWDQEETIALIGAVTQGILSYLVPNDTGPDREELKARVAGDRGTTLVEALVVVFVILVILVVLFRLL